MTAKSQSYGPQYYKRGNIEVWDFIKDQDLNYFLGNAIKYICRAGYKDDPKKDLQKAIHYLAKELSHVSDNNPRHTQDIPQPTSGGVPKDLLDWQFEGSGTSD